jgi:hypothetical protein
MERTTPRACGAGGKPARARGGERNGAGTRVGLATQKIELQTPTGEDCARPRRSAARRRACTRATSSPIYGTATLFAICSFIGPARP